MRACSVFLSLFFQPAVKGQIDENSNHHVTQCFLFDILISCYTLRLLTAYLWYLHCHLQYIRYVTTFYYFLSTVHKICPVVNNAYFCQNSSAPVHKIVYNSASHYIMQYFFRNTSIVVRTKNRFTNEENINVILKSDIPISICVYSNI